MPDGCTLPDYRPVVNTSDSSASTSRFASFQFATVRKYSARSFAKAASEASLSRRERAAARISLIGLSLHRYNLGVHDFLVVLVATGNKLHDLVTFLALLGKLIKPLRQQVRG